MVELQGIPVAPGVAIGPALVLDADGYRIPRCLVAAEDAEQEYARLRTAVDAVSERLETARLETAAVAGEETGDIFAAQLQMLHDPRLHIELKKRIVNEYPIGRLRGQPGVAQLRRRPASAVQSAVGRSCRRCVGHRKAIVAAIWAP